MEMKKIVLIGGVILILATIMQIAGSFIVLRISIEPKPYPLPNVILPTSPPPSQVAGLSWHIVETWTITVLASVIAYRSPILVLRREDEEDDGDLDNEKRMKRLADLQKLQKKKRRFRWLVSSARNSSSFLPSLIFRVFPLIRHSNHQKKNYFSFEVLPSELPKTRNVAVSRYVSDDDSIMWSLGCFLVAFPT
jgi:hypothetical protein